MPTREVIGGILLLILALLVAPTFLVAQASLGANAGWATWGGEDYPSADGGILLEAVARVEAGTTLVGVGVLSSEFTPGPTNTNSFTNLVIFGELRREFPQESPSVTPFLSARLGWATDRGTFGGANVVPETYKSTGLMYASVVGVAFAVTENLAFEVSGILGWTRSSEITRGGSQRPSETDNGRMLGVRSTTQLLRVGRQIRRRKAN